MNLEVTGEPPGSDNTARFSKWHELSLAWNYKAVKLHFVNDWSVPKPEVGLRSTKPMLTQMTCHAVAYKLHYSHDPKNRS